MAFVCWPYWRGVHLGLWPGDVVHGGYFSWLEAHCGQSAAHMDGDMVYARQCQRRESRYAVPSRH